MTIRDATQDDFPSITAIYNEVILHSTAIYRDEPVTVADRIALWRARSDQGYPTLVAHDGEAVLGFAWFGDFRSGVGYRFTVEHTVHVDAACRGQGIGSELLEALIPRAAALGKHVMIGGIDAENAGSLRFHERHGFERVAHCREVGYKFGRFLDLVLVQRIIPPLSPPELQPRRCS
jgi:phosphinothricin acetyltransferase